MLNSARCLVVGLWLLLALPIVALAALSWPLAYRWVDPSATAVMRYRVEQARAQGDALELRQSWVRLSRISPWMIRAAVASEDGRFRDHNGVDWIALGEELRYQGDPPFSFRDKDDLRALVGAGRYYLEHRDQVRGRSTITQQLARTSTSRPSARSRARPASCSSRGGWRSSSARTASSSCT